MPVCEKPRPDWHRRTSAGDPDASTTASSEDFACEPCSSPFEQQPQYKAPSKKRPCSPQAEELNSEGRSQIVHHRQYAHRHRITTEKSARGSNPSVAVR